MRIVIYGAGVVGRKIAETLSYEKQDVTIVDPDKSKLDKVQKDLDVLCLAGFIGDDDFIKEINIQGSNIFIAVTDSDEENIVACSIAKKQNVVKTIARIRNPAYMDKELFDAKVIGIDYMINPEKELAKEIARIIRTPWASEVDSFIMDKVFVFEVKINQENLEYLKKNLALLEKSAAIIKIENINGDKKLVFYDRNIGLRDHIFIIVKRNDVSKINEIFKEQFATIQNIMIVGGGVTGFELLTLLEKTNVKIKLIEENKSICSKLSGRYKKALVLCGDGTDLNLLKSENIDRVDCFISITGYDEDNIMAALLAKQQGVKKSIIRISKDYEEDIVAGIGLDAAVNIYRVTINKILNFVRKKELIALSIIDNDLEIIEICANKNSKITKRPIKDAQFIKGAIIAIAYRAGNIFFPGKNFRFKPDDRALIFLNKRYSDIVEKYFRG